MTLEDEIPEVTPVTTQKSPETTTATSSQQMEERSQPEPKTPPASSQKDQVVSTGTPQSMIRLLDALDIAQIKISSSQSPVNEDIPQQVTESRVSISVNLPTVEKATLQELQVIPVSSSSGAATTGVEPTNLHLDSSFISETPLKAISSLGIIVSTGVFPLYTGDLKMVTSAEERSP